MGTFSFKETRARDGGSDVKESRVAVIRCVVDYVCLELQGRTWIQVEVNRE